MPYAPQKRPPRPKISTISSARYPYIQAPVKTKTVSKCISCGAPLEVGETQCAYCGTHYNWD